MGGSSWICASGSGRELPEKRSSAWKSLLATKLATTASGSTACSKHTGIRNYVIDPASLQVDRRARRVKTDHVDVERLLRSLMAYLRGEPKVWSVVRVPSVAEEDDRRLHRERGRLVGERVQHVNRIKGLLAIHGIYDYQPLHRDSMQQLKRLHTADGSQLSPRLKAEIVRELQRLELVLEMIETIEAERDAIALAKTKAKTKMEHSNAKKIQDLVKVKSIGPEFASRRFAIVNVVPELIWECAIS